jgi:hypothetical protein
MRLRMAIPGNLNVTLELHDLFWQTKPLGDEARVQNQGIITPANSP